MSSNRKYLFRRSGGNYQLVMKIPSDIQPILNAKWIKRSLKTSNIKNANFLLDSIAGKIQTSFTLLRSGVLTDDQMIAIKTSILPCKRTSSKTPDKTLHKLIDQYILERSPNWSKATKASFEQKFEHLKNVLSNEIITSYKREDFVDFRNLLIQSGLQPKTINIRISLLSSLLKWCVQHGYLERNYAEGLQLKQEKAPDEQRKVYDPDDLKRITDNIPRSQRCSWQYSPTPDRQNVLPDAMLTTSGTGVKTENGLSMTARGGLQIPLEELFHISRKWWEHYIQKSANLLTAEQCRTA